MRCPYCYYDDVPRGALVCRGCGAEIKYGAPGWVIVPVLAIAYVLGRGSGSWLVAGLAFLVSGAAFAWLMRSKVAFVRSLRH
ncbi:MAG: hypothetical protein WDO69_06820 [Pseudomonadota bacterium]